MSSQPDSTLNNPKKGGCLRTLGILYLIVLLVGGIGGYFYWQSVKKTPQYSLALLVDAARRDDKEIVAKIIDTEQVVNNFVPQISEKAVEIYGRNIPAPIISKIAQFVTPLMPAIKDKAKEELPNFISVYGTNGTLHIGWRESKYKLNSSPDWNVFGTGYDKVQAFRSKIENFRNAILNGEELLTKPEDALASVSVIEAAYKSLNQNLWQKVVEKVETAKK
ncbi:MAG: hypothetical protein MUC29_09795 [Pyrinomonadaceae bacterium]|nr:hypothetical protein [Pyrinomonadaceae bacterium]